MALSDLRKCVALAILAVEEGFKQVAAPRSGQSSHLARGRRRKLLSTKPGNTTTSTTGQDLDTTGQARSQTVAGGYQRIKETHPQNRR
jgi:hypothetical protein